ncbi:cobalamin-dependent protein [Streptomyces sp. ICN988]|uniref:cobalamin B12-binding domain-containing protein n=1 Tax=unclassified Streptomyces TaxID=2593676 RepID=UPI0021E50610|nr:cobalamin-dependent protein [Streptomyces sp. ICN988]MCV2463765.1 cobalamin-dependent protein [Streptomyces sp. ICN988]
MSGTSSDAHTWNLIHIHLFLEERGYTVTNLGSCVPDDLLVRTCRELRPDLVVLSSINGHGFTDGLQAIRAVRRQRDVRHLPVVIGGKLGTDGLRNAGCTRRLLEAGFDAVFDNGDLGAFDRFLNRHRAAAA